MACLGVHALAVRARWGLWRMCMLAVAARMWCNALAVLKKGMLAVCAAALRAHAADVICSGAVMQLFRTRCTLR